MTSAFSPSLDGLTVYFFQSSVSRHRIFRLPADDSPQKSGWRPI